MSMESNTKHNSSFHVSTSTLSMLAFIILILSTFFAICMTKIRTAGSEYDFGSVRPIKITFGTLQLMILCLILHVINDVAVISYYTTESSNDFIRRISKLPSFVIPLLLHSWIFALALYSWLKLYWSHHWKDQ